MIEKRNVNLKRYSQYENKKIVKSVENEKFHNMYKSGGKFKNCCERWILKKLWLVEISCTNELQ